MLQQLSKLARCLRWLPSYAGRQLSTKRYDGPVHLIVAVADHFEPAIIPASGGTAVPFDEQERRLSEWCRDYPKVMLPWRDADGRPFVHTYFYPAEQYSSELIEQLACHCKAGWGEIEIHLHHGVSAPDTAEHTRHLLICFRDALVDHGCLSKWNGKGKPRYAFVHGNWALANSMGGRCCGVDSEMQILAHTGCYADLTYPAAPSPAQVPKVNALYECGLPLDRRAPHRSGRDLQRGRAPSTFPLIIQGPLGMDFGSKGGLPIPRIENSEITAAHPPSLRRLAHWKDTAITVKGKPDWVFVKLHCHGMDPRDHDVMLGPTRSAYLRDLTTEARESGNYHLHFVTAREMVNIALAACDGRDGKPGDYRDYRLRLIQPQAHNF